MHIALHAGAYGTEEDRLLKTLLRNRERFAQQDIAVPGPARYRQILRETLGAMDNTAPAQDARALLLDTILDGQTAKRMILSHMHIFGAPRACLRDGMLYDLAPRRLGQLRDLFAEDRIELFLALKNPATFLPALFASSPQNSISAFMRGADPRDIRWSHTLSEIRASVPEVTITAWCFEDMPMIWPQIVRQMAGIGNMAPVAGEFDLLTQILDPEGMHRLRVHFRENPDMTEEEQRECISDIMSESALEDAIEEEIDAPGWSETLIDELTELYDADVRACARIPGVTLIAP